MKRSKGRKDVLRSRKNGNGEKPQEEKSQIGTLPTKLRGNEVLLPIRASLTERGSASFMHSQGLSSVFTRRPPPRFEAASPAPEFLQAYPQPRPNCTGW